MAKEKPEKPTPGKPARKKSKVQEARDAWAPSRAHGQSASFMKQMCADMRAEYGDAGITTAGEAGRLVLGIPLPSLAFEYLIQNSVFPLTRVVQLVGPPKTCKSGLCFEISKWFWERSAGNTMLFENEGKYSPDWASSIIGWDNPHTLGHTPCTSVEDWQRKMKKFIIQAKTYATGTAKEPGPGRVMPSLIILDSLMGKLSETTLKNIELRGYAEKHFAVEALQITEYLKAISSEFQEWPMSLLVVNHLKMGKTAQGLPERRKAGGYHMTFQESLELEMAPVMNGKISLAAKPNRPAISGKSTRIKCMHNALGQEGRSIIVDILWWQEAGPTGRMRQITAWDWHAATVRLLTDPSFAAGIRANIRDIVDLRGVGGEEKSKLFWSKTLGVSEATPMSASQIGQVIFDNREVTRELRNLFGIKVRRPFSTGEDFLKLFREVKEDTLDEIEELENAARERAASVRSGSEQAILRAAEAEGGGPFGGLSSSDDADEDGPTETQVDPFDEE